MSRHPPPQSDDPKPSLARKLAHKTSLRLPSSSQRKPTTTPVPEDEEPLSPTTPTWPKTTTTSTMPSSPQPHASQPGPSRPRTSPNTNSTSAPPLRAKPSFRRRFWSRSGANNFHDDPDLEAESYSPPSSNRSSSEAASKASYVPRHAASDFSRMGGRVSYDLPRVDEVVHTQARPRTHSGPGRRAAVETVPETRADQTRSDAQGQSQGDTKGEIKEADEGPSDYEIFIKKALERERKYQASMDLHASHRRGAERSNTHARKPSKTTPAGPKLTTKAHQEPLPHSSKPVLKPARPDQPPTSKAMAPKPSPTTREPAQVSRAPGLRRQASVAQRIAEYIRPPRPSRQGLVS